MQLDINIIILPMYLIKKKAQNCELYAIICEIFF
jgi:hypothetical protein